MIVTSAEYLPQVLFHALSDAQWNIYCTTRIPTDLDYAIATTQIAIDLAVELGPSSAGLLFDLGFRLHARYELNNSLHELGDAISAMRDTSAFTAGDDPGKPLRLGHLGAYLRERYDRTGGGEDLNEAIASPVDVGSRESQLCPTLGSTPPTSAHRRRSMRSTKQDMVATAVRCYQ